MKDNFTKELADNLLRHYRGLQNKLVGMISISEMRNLLRAYNANMSVEHCTLKVFSVSIYNSERVKKSGGFGDDTEILFAKSPEAIRAGIAKVIKRLEEMIEYWWSPITVFGKTDEEE